MCVLFSSFETLLFCRLVRGSTERAAAAANSSVFTCGAEPALSAWLMQSLLSVVGISM